MHEQRVAPRSRASPTMRVPIEALALAARRTAMRRARSSVRVSVASASISRVGPPVQRPPVHCAMRLSATGFMRALACHARESARGDLGRRTDAARRRPPGRARGPCRRPARCRLDWASRDRPRDRRGTVALDRSRVAAARSRRGSRATMASPSSLRGLSSVTMTMSARRSAIAAICGRLPRSRSPPQPNTQIRRPARVPRSDASACSSASGVCA